jgi:hypothetical protein
MSTLKTDGVQRLCITLATRDLTPEGSGIPKRKLRSLTFSFDMGRKSIMRIRAERLPFIVPFGREARRLSGAFWRTERGSMCDWVSSVLCLCIWRFNRQAPVGPQVPTKNSYRSSNSFSRMELERMPETAVAEL